MIVTVTANAAADKRYVVGNMQVGEVNRLKEADISAGGKGLNVSRAAYIAGEKVIATGFLAGHTGELVQDKIGEDGFASDFVWCSGETRSCLNIWDETNRTQTELLEPGFTATAEDQDHLVEKFRDLVKDASIASVSGSLPKGCGSELYGRLIDEARKLGKRVILDTSGQTLADCLAFRPFMIKPNIDEIRQLVKKNLDPEQKEEIFAAADKLHGMGIPVVVISLGASGSLMSCPEGVFQARVPKIQAVNTVGCGDSMIGGFDVGFERGLSSPECLRIASAISAAAAMTDRTGFFRMEDMEQIRSRIEITKLR